jgi:ribonucleoside-diphosphate reductase alpha chain
MVEESVWSENNTDKVLFIPVVPPKKSIFKDDLVGVKQLSVVKSIQNNWVEYGTNVDLCSKPFLRHNVSNTVEVEDWESVMDYLWENKKYFSGVSFLPKKGDKIYNQAPFTSVLTETQLVEKYGSAAILGSGLVVDGLDYFGNLWEACDYALKRDLQLIGSRKELLLKRDWLKRFKIFAKRYLKNNLELTSFCLKDIHLYHKWCNVNRVLNQKEIDLSKLTLKPEYTEVDTMGAASCYGGACEIPDYILSGKQQQPA